MGHHVNNWIGDVIQSLGKLTFNIALDKSSYIKGLSNASSI